MQIKNFLNRFINKFLADDTTTLAASLAFYMAFSLAPLLILFVSITAHLDTDLQQGLIVQVNDLAGHDAAKAVSSIIYGTRRTPELASFAGLVSAFTLLLSASLIFSQLSSTLNRILDCKSGDNNQQSFVQFALGYLRGKLLHILIAVAFILVMIASVLVSTVLTAGFNHQDGIWGLALNALVSATLYVVMFSLTFHYLPDQRLEWKRAIQGGAITAILFAFGKELIGIYLGSAALGSAYGAAGSIVVFLVWVYYSALITFVGAQVSSLLGNNAPGRFAERH